MNIIRRKMYSGFRKMFTTFNKGYIQITCGLTKMVGYDRLMDDYMKSTCKVYEKNSDYYTAYKIRPKTEKNIYLLDEHYDTDKKIAIVMQGPIFCEDHFTLETIRIYSKLFPNAKVIVSTWKGENETELDSIKKEKNCVVILNDRPTDSGILNSNLQCITTLNGIRKAKELGCEYVMKTRGDWRIYAKGSLRMMVNLLQAFPCTGNILKQHQRIIAADIATEETSIMFYPFWITDLLMFGQVDDMEKYWDSTFTKGEGLDKKGVDSLIRENNYSWKRRVQEGLLNEARIPLDYIKRETGREQEISVYEYWKYLKDYFMIVPKSLLDAFWFKYQDRRLCESADWGTCFINDNQENLLTYNFDFAMWLNLYSGDLLYKPEYEKISEERTYRY